MGCSGEQETDQHQRYYTTPGNWVGEERATNSCSWLTIMSDGWS